MTQENYEQEPLSLGLKEATAAYEKVNKSFETGGGGAAALNTSLTTHEQYNRSIQQHAAAYLATEESSYQYGGGTATSSASKPMNFAGVSSTTANAAANWSSMTEGTIDGMTLLQQSPVVLNHQSSSNHASILLRRPQSDLNLIAGRAIGGAPETHNNVSKGTTGGVGKLQGQHMAARHAAL